MWPLSDLQPFRGPCRKPAQSECFGRGTGEIQRRASGPGTSWRAPQPQLRWCRGSTIQTGTSIHWEANIWKYKLQDRSLTQITFGTGEDFSPMPDPRGKGIYYVSGRFSGSLTAYNVHSKRSTDIVPEGA